MENRSYIYSEDFSLKKIFAQQTFCYQTNPKKVMKFYINNIHIIISSFIAIIWAFFYLIFEKLHGMTEMYNEQFPFIVSNILGLDGNYLPIGSGLFLATLDGLIVGYVLGWIVKRMFR